MAYSHRMYLPLDKSSYEYVLEAVSKLKTLGRTTEKMQGISGTEANKTASTLFYDAASDIERIVKKGESLLNETQNSPGMSR